MQSSNMAESVSYIFFLFFFLWLRGLQLCYCVVYNIAMWTNIFFLWIYIYCLLPSGCFSCKTPFTNFHKEKLAVIHGADVIIFSTPHILFLYNIMYSSWYLLSWHWEPVSNELILHFDSAERKTWSEMLN